MSWSILSESLSAIWVRADGVGVLLRGDRSDLSIMNYDSYMPGIDASAGYITVLLEQTTRNRRWSCELSANAQQP
jgi:hypothetical protein